MRTAKVFVIAVFVLLSFSLIAQEPSSPPQPPPDAAPPQQEPNAVPQLPPDTVAPPPSQAPDANSQQQENAASQQSAPDAAASLESNRSPAAPAPLDMQPVKSELVSKLDSKTAKAGDSVVVKTKEPVKTADGIVIPKGSKLVGRVTTVQSHSHGSQNSAMAIRFDRAELKDGKTIQIESLIKSVAPPESAMAASTPAFPDASAGAGAPVGGTMAGMNAGAGRSGGGAPMGGAVSSQAPDLNQMGASAGQSNSVAAGKVVGKTNDADILTTEVPGVLLASSAPSEATTVSGTLFAAKDQVRLEAGTQMVLEVSAAK